jgi:hypothetical protein
MLIQYTSIKLTCQYPIDKRQRFILVDCLAYSMLFDDSNPKALGRHLPLIMQAPSGNLFPVIKKSPLEKGGLREF